jgi:hypothetical protein
MWKTSVLAVETLAQEVASGKMMKRPRVLSVRRSRAVWDTIDECMARR